MELIVNKKKTLSAYINQNNNFELRGHITQAQGARTLNSKEETSYDLIHQRFAHASKEVMMQIPNHTKGAPNKISTQPKEICEGCAKGKSVRQPHPLSPERAKETNEIVHSDVYTLPISTYKSNIKYVVTFLDDATSYCRMFFITHKHETFNCFKKYINWSERQTGRKLKTIRSDHGGEFISKEFQAYLDESGIS
jgi:hypothetical protein